jgi:phage terminase Nu1 subunit (DNA packaging protein)
MNDANLESALVKKSELAKVLSVSPRTVDNWVAQRIIPYLATSPRMHLFDVSAVKKALATKFEVAART